MSAPYITASSVTGIWITLGLVDGLNISDTIVMILLANISNNATMLSTRTALPIA